MSWKFHCGIHRGTLTSRDAEMPKSLGTLEACREEADRALRAYRALGCQIWFCYASGPDGSRVTLLPGAPYAR